MRVRDLKRLISDLKDDIEIKVYSEDSSFEGFGIDCGSEYFEDIDEDASGLIEIDNNLIFLITPHGKIYTTN